jgi:hypothetical protein
MLPTIGSGNTMKSGLPFRRQKDTTTILKMAQGANAMGEKMMAEKCKEELKRVFVTKSRFRPEPKNGQMVSCGLTKDQFMEVVGNLDRVDQLIECGMNHNLIGMSENGTYSPTEDGLAAFWP